MQQLAAVLLLLAPWGSQIDLPRVAVGNLTLTAVRARIRYRDGAVMLEQLTASLPAAGKAAALSGRGFLRVTPPVLLSLQLRAEGIDLAALEQLPAGMRPPLRLAGTARIDLTVEGSWRQRTLEARGTVRTSETAVERLRLGATEFVFALDADHLRIDAARARFSGGELAGSATLPLRVTEPGAIDLTLKEVDVAQAVKALAGTTLPFKGRLTGTVKGVITAAKADQERGLRAVVDVTGQKLRVRNVPVQRLHGDVRYRGGPVEYEPEAAALGARVPVVGQIPPPRRR